MIRLLIVDDEPASIRVARKLLAPLESNFSEILTAENGVDALLHIDSPRPPELIITDMEMPVMGGISLLEYLTENHPEIRVIVASGYYDFKYTHAAIRANTVDYLLKPLDRQELLRVVSRALAAISESDGVAVDTGSEARIPQEVYLRLIRHIHRLTQALSDADTSLLHELLSADSAYVEGSIDDPSLYPFVYKLYTDALVQFCLDREYPVPQIPSLSREDAMTASGVFQTLTALHDRCVEAISAERRHSTSDENLERISNYIHNHYRENLTLAEVADIFYINKGYLSTLFREKYGETVGQLITRLKIADAKRQLRYSDRTLAEIAESLGYQDTVYFNKQFKKETGLPPGQFRSQGAGK